MNSKVLQQMDLGKLDGIKKNEGDLYKRAKNHGGDKLSKVKYGEYVLVKQVVQFADGVIRMECAREYDGKWVTLSRNTKLKSPNSGALPENDRERLFVVTEQPPMDTSTVYVLRQHCDPCVVCCSHTFLRWIDTKL